VHAEEYADLGIFRKCFYRRVGCDYLACQCEAVALGGGSFQYYPVPPKCFAEAPGIGNVQGSGW